MENTRLKIKSSDKITIIPHEHLISNNLDANLQAFIKPLEWTQIPLFQRKYRIRDNFITPNGYFIKTISCVVTLLYIIITMMNLNFFDEQGFQNFYLVYVGPQLFCFMGSIVLVFLCFANVINTDNNVQLILNIQATRRVFKYCDDGIKRLVIESKTVCGITLMLIFLIEVTSYFYLNHKITAVIGQIPQFHYDATIMYACSVVKLIRVTFALWLEEMKIRMKLELNSSLEEMERAFLSLNKAFQLYQKVFSIPVS